MEPISVPQLETTLLNKQIIIHIYSLAVNDLRDKAKRSFYAIKRSINTELPITTWLNKTGKYLKNIKFKSCIQSSAKNIIQVQRKVPNSACRAELGQYPLLLNIQKCPKFLESYFNKWPNLLSFCLLVLRLGEPSTTQVITPMTTSILGHMHSEN